VPDLIAPARLSLLGALVVVALTACSQQADPQAPVATTTAASPSPTATDAADEAAVADVVADYVDAMVTMENSAQVDPAPMHGIATETVAKAEAKRVKDLVDQGIHREGRPTLGEATVTVDGDSARYEVCMDQDDWVGVLGDQTVGSSYGPLPTGWSLTRTDGDWLVSATIPQEQVRVTC